MQVVIRSRNGRVEAPAVGDVGPVVLVPAAVVAVEFLEVGWVVDVQFVGGDANDGAFFWSVTVEYCYLYGWYLVGRREERGNERRRKLTIFLMKFSNLERVLSLLDHVVVEFVPGGDGS